MGESLAQSLEPLASQFRALNLPDILTHWGHPFFMSIVMFGMGGYGAYAGWKGRVLTATDVDAAIKNKTDHKKIMPAMFGFMAIGATGGVLSLVIQKQEVMAIKTPFMDNVGILTTGILFKILTVILSMQEPKVGM